MYESDHPIGGCTLDGHVILQIPFGHETPIPINVHVVWAVVTNPRHKDISSSSNFPHLLSVTISGYI